MMFGHQRQAFNETRNAEIRKVMGERREIRRRACHAIGTIAELRENGSSFDELIDFHRKLYDLSDKR